MPYKIAGTLSYEARLIIMKESDWSIESNTISGSGSYEITSLVSGTKWVTARKSDGEVISYGNVEAAFYAPDVVIDSNTTWSSNQDYSDSNIVITNNATVTIDDPDSQIVISALNLTIDSGAKISAPNGGPGGNCTSNPGPASCWAPSPGGGYCNSTWGQGGGGAHGGNGGRGYKLAGGYVPGGSSHGSPTEPTTRGGGGGGSTIGKSYIGGDGGGALKLNITETLTVNGEIESNGNNGTGRASESLYHGGGGAGGSVWIIAGSGSGNGTISADGGNGLVWTSNYGGGGGSGGRISINCSDWNFSGATSYTGGTGHEAGQSGSYSLVP